MILYISSTSNKAPNALIVYDKFHIVQKLNTTVDTVRKKESFLEIYTKQDELSAEECLNQWFELCINSGIQAFVLLYTA